MKCPNPNCRAENPDDATFCRACGKQIRQLTIPEMYPKHGFVLSKNIKWSFAHIRFKKICRFAQFLTFVPIVLVVLSYWNYNVNFTFFDAPDSLEFFKKRDGSVILRGEVVIVDKDLIEKNENYYYNTDEHTRDALYNEGYSSVKAIDWDYIVYQREDTTSLGYLTYYEDYVPFNEVYKHISVKSVVLPFVFYCKKENNYIDNEEYNTKWDIIRRYQEYVLEGIAITILVGILCLVITQLIIILISKVCPNKIQSKSIGEISDYIQGYSPRYKIIVKDKKFGLIDMLKHEVLIQPTYDFLEWKNFSKTLTALKNNCYYTVDKNGSVLK